MPISSYNMPSSSLGKVRRFYEMKKASGQKVQPWELESSLSAEFDTANKNALSGRALEESIAQNAENNAIRREGIDAQKSGQLMGGVGNMLTTGAGLRMLTMKPGDKFLGETINNGIDKILPSGTPTTTPPVGPEQLSGPGMAGETAPAEFVTPAAAGAAGGAALTSSFNPAQLEAIKSGATYEQIAALGESGVASGASTTGAVLEGATAPASGTSIAGGTAPAASQGMLGPAAAGFAGGSLARTTGLGEKISDNAPIGGTHEWSSALGAGAGMGAAALLATGPVGWGALAAGGLLGALGGSSLAEDAGCIIVTACTSPDSDEVNVTREYRDKYMDKESLRGYYRLAQRIVPIINKYPAVKWMVKKALVDNLISYGKHILRGEKRPGIFATIITKSFLFLCKESGRNLVSFTRLNGEVL